MIRRVTLGLLLVLALGAPAMASATSEQPAATQVAPASATPIPADPADASGYAKREQDDKQVANYEGGNVIVIGISGGALVVLLLFLLIFLP